MGMFLRRGAVASGPKLGDIEVGTIVKLNENGSPVEFYVAKHDYEAELNGSGRTLLVRKDCYTSSVWDQSSKYSYISNTIDNLLNNSYLGVLDSGVTKILSATKIYCTNSYSNSTVTTIERAIFLLSVTEISGTAPGCNEEGSLLPIGEALKIANTDGAVAPQWTRTLRTQQSGYAMDFDSWGSVTYARFRLTYGVRPAFCLPAETKVGDGNLITG